MSGAVESSKELELESGDYEGRAGQSRGEQMDNILPTTGHMDMEEDPVNFTVSMENLPLSVPSENELSLSTAECLKLPWLVPLPHQQ